MSTLRPAPVSSTRFTWSKPERMFVAFASDLGRQPFGRVYDDACDEGLTLVSRYNGEELVLVVNHTEVDREGDLRYWDLVPADFRPARFAVRVYND